MKFEKEETTSVFSVDNEFKKMLNDSITYSFPDTLLTKHTH
jgi:hypothetical protein